MADHKRLAAYEKNVLCVWCGVLYVIDVVCVMCMRLMVCVIV